MSTLSFRRSVHLKGSLDNACILREKSTARSKSKQSFAVHNWDYFVGSLFEIEP